MVQVTLDLTHNIRQGLADSSPQLLLTKTSLSALERTHETYLYLAGFTALAATVSAKSLHTHARAGGDHARFGRLLIALVISNTAASSCHLGAALIVYVYSISNALISDQLYQTLLLVSDPSTVALILNKYRFAHQFSFSALLSSAQAEQRPSEED